MMSERFFILFIVMLSPYTKLPGAEAPLPFRPIDLFLVTIGTVIFIKKKFFIKQFTWIALAMALVLGTSLASAFLGIFNLSENGLDYLALNQGLISYYPFAFTKVIQILICFIGFLIVVNSSAIRNKEILVYWFYSLVMTVVLHIGCYVFSDNYFIQRSGVFVEGNHGGSYYLMSFFLMWWASNQGWKFGRVGMMLAFIALLLSQSTTSIYCAQHLHIFFSA
jgi:hypothetical protein